MAPALFGWMRFTRQAWPQFSAINATTKAFAKQLTIVPLSTAAFFAVMKYMESLDWRSARREVCKKFWPSYEVKDTNIHVNVHSIFNGRRVAQVGIFYWPMCSMVSFRFVSPHNRIVFSSLCGLVWNTFLAYMKHLDRSDKMRISNMVLATRQMTRN